MSAKPILCELGPLGDGETRQRIQVFPPPGEYVHPRGNRKFTLTADTLAEFAENLNATDRIPIDRDHAFFKGMNAPAAGWFVPGTASADESGVTAEVEWTPSGADQVRNREYRFVSPEFGFAKRMMNGQHVPEPTVHAATVTNRPFFEHMEPLAAETEEEEMNAVLAEAVESGLILACDVDLATEEETAELVAAAASKKPYGNVSYADPGYQEDGKARYPLDTEEHVRAAWSYINKAKNAAKYTAAQLSRIKSRIKRAMSRIGAKIGADSTEGGNVMDLTVLAETLGIAADASEDEVAEGLRTLVAERDALKDKLEKAPTDETIRTLVADAAKGVEAANKLAAREKKDALDEAIRLGKIVPAERESYEKLYDLDAEGVAKILAEKPAVLNFAAAGTPDARVFDAEGNPVKTGEDGEPIVADLTPQLVDGVEMPVNEDSAKIHAAAVSLLRSQGKQEYTAEEYTLACEKVIPTLGVSR